MPNWKKIVVSGSDAELNSLNVTTSLTASGNIYPTNLGVDRQVIKTDGLGNLSFGYSEEIIAIVKNVSGVTLLKGTPVHATQSGAMGNVVGIIAASASNAATMPATFVLNETLIDEAEGEALASGFIQGVDTSAFEVGDVVYVGENGGYTNVKPTGSNRIQNLGIVTKVDAVNGSGFILGAGRANDVPNIIPGYLWVGNSDWVATPTPTSSLSVASAISSSYALTASYALNGGGGGPSTPTFPYTGSAIISGSLEITGSFSVNNGTATKIDTSISQLLDDTSIDSVDWQNRYLLDTAGNISSDWTNRVNLDSSGNTSIDWENRVLWNTNGIIVDYSGTSSLNIINYRPTAERLELQAQDDFTQNAIGTSIFNAAGNLIETETNIATNVSSSHIVYLDSDGVWKQTNQTTDTSTKILGICIQPWNKGLVLLEGIVNVTTSSAILDVPLVAGSTFYGMPVYLTGSAAKFTTNKPTSGYVRVAGHMYYNSTTNTDYWIMKFNPSNDWYQI
jgi:hypothetical protein